MAMKKYGKTGWFNYGSKHESERHSLASRGICTGRKSSLVSRMPNINYSKGFKPEVFTGYWFDKDGKRVSFNLYGEEDIDFDATKDAIMDNMENNHFEPMKKLFSKYGLELKEFQWYSPSEYNFEGDSVDLVVQVKDKKKLKQFIKNNKVEIQKKLDANKSYDGYMALTSRSVNEILDKIDNRNDVDVMVISYIQSKYPLNMYDDVYDRFVYEDTPEDK
jgi:hypothetical protein